MAHPIGKKEESRAKILASAGQGFRRHGFGGLGIDGLAKAAGVTSGAFYAHFRSKSDAFRAAVAAGMGALADGVAQLRAEGGAWVPRFIAFYLTERRTCELGESCALQSLTNEVARADMETRVAYGVELRRTIAMLADGLGENGDGRARAIALLALLSGGVSMARAVEDGALADDIIAAVRDATLRVAAFDPDEAPAG
jgi:AcrR family transcriptional regulator